MNKEITLENWLHELGHNNEIYRMLDEVFHLQKNKLKRYLSASLASFPTYSEHDSNHSENIIIAVENLLGDERIKEMSGADIFLILMAAYMHDIGMILTDKEVRETWVTENFQEFLIESMSRKDEIGRAALEIKKNNNIYIEKSDWPLNIKRNVIILITEYFRPSHGSRIYKHTDVKQSIIASLIEIDSSYLSIRIKRLINSISMAHTKNIEWILENLPKEDSIKGKTIHPRMIASLLRLGDLCDLDNDRFNLVSTSTFGKLDVTNLAHFYKHQTVTNLFISKEVINIQVNVDFDFINNDLINMNEDIQDDEKEEICQKVVKEHILWKGWLTDEIISIKTLYNEIFPDYYGNLPDVFYEILIDGKRTASSIENMKFNFSQEKAYNLIESISIYNNEPFIFVRELVQNSIDAIKMQMWKDIIEGKFDYMWNKEDIYEDSLDFYSHLKPYDFDKKVWDNYKININAKIDILKDKCVFEINDNGIGISIDDLKENILKTGNSWNKRSKYREYLSCMPEWLKPTGAFGIGLHSVFTITDRINIISKSDFENHTNIFSLNSGMSDGFVFCQIENNNKKKRGSTIKFDFKLSNEIEYGIVSHTIPFELVLENEYESLIKNTLNKWCRSSLFSIELNEIEEIEPTCKSNLFSEIFDLDKRNIYNNINYIVDGYDYAFSERYDAIVIWDRKKDILYRANIDEYNYEGLLLCKGMVVELNKYNPFDSINDSFVNIEIVNILSRFSDEIVNAARDAITNSFSNELRIEFRIIEKVILNLYEKLVINLLEDNDLKRYNILIDGLVKSEGYNYIFKDFYKQVIIIKSKFFDYNKNDINARNLTFKILLQCIDKSIFYAIKELLQDNSKNSLNNEDMIDWCINKLIYFKKTLWILDNLIKRIKTESKRGVINKEIYYDNINQQCKLIIEKSLLTIGFFIGKIYLTKCKNSKTFSGKYMKILNRNIEENTEKVKSTLFSLMDFLAKSYLKKYVYGNLSLGLRKGLEYEFNCYFLEESFFEESYLDIEDFLWQSNSYKRLGVIEPEMFNKYNNNILLSYDLPINNIIWRLFSFPKYEISEKTNDLVIEYYENRLIGLVDLEINNIGNIVNFFKNKKIEFDINKVNIVLDYYRFLNNLPINKMRLVNGKINIELVANLTDRPIIADEDVIKKYFKIVVEKIKRCTDQGEYEEVFVFDNYSNLKMDLREKSYTNFDDVNWKNSSVPLWTTSCDLVSFILERNDDTFEEIYNYIIESKNFESIVNYIYINKYLDKVNYIERISAIQDEYRKIIKYLLEAFDIEEVYG